MTKLWWRLIRLGFRLLYNEFAWTYDLVSWTVSLGRWRQWQRAAMRYLDLGKSAAVLELAHGTANLQLDLVAAGWTPIGLDLSPRMGAIAANKLKNAGIRPRLIRASALHLPFRDGAFVHIVSTFPTEFILHPDTLGELRRVLLPGGRVVVVLNGMLRLGNPLVRLLEMLYRITGQRGPWPDDPFAGFRKVGLAPELHIDELADSNVWVLVADKERQ